MGVKPGCGLNARFDLQQKGLARIGGQQWNDTLGASISGHLLRSPRFIELCSCRVPIRAIKIETEGKLVVA
jgi:hypothetical protein